MTPATPRRPSCHRVVRRRSRKHQPRRRHHLRHRSRPHSRSRTRRRRARERPPRRLGTPPGVAAGLAVPAGSAAAAATPTAGIDVRPRGHAAAVLVGAHRSVLGDPCRRDGVLILQGAARSWMIFAIVWGSIVFVGQIGRNFGNSHRHTTTEQVVTVHADTSGFVHVIGPGVLQSLNAGPRCRRRGEPVGFSWPGSPSSCCSRGCAAAA